MKPILFNTEMVRAILDSRKTVTRRVIKHDVDAILNSPFHKKHPEEEDKQIISKLCLPPYHPGDILYVRETWGEGYEEGTYIYKADDKLANLLEFKESSKLIYRPSIHMPKEAARIFLKVTGVRVERLQDMRLDDFKKEGTIATSISPEDDLNYRFEFSNLWDSTIKKDQLQYYGWDANPYVWVIEFEAIDKAVAMANDTEEKRK